MSRNGLYQSTVTHIRTKLATLNIYESPNDNAETIHRGILATRIFLLLLIVVTISLSMGAFVRENTKTETVESPTRARFFSLQERYSDTLTCPCTTIAIPFGQFADVQSSFHQVCSSDFVSQRWIDFIFGANATSIWIMDVRTSISSMWQLIASLCQSSIASVNSGTDEFKRRLLISSMVLPEEVLKSKSNSALDEDKLKMKVNFQTTFGIFYMGIVMTMPLSGLMTNFVLYAPDLWRSTFSFTEAKGIRYELSDGYSFCNCFWARSCQLQGNIYLYKSWETHGIYNLSAIQPNGTIPGLVVDCMPYQAVSNSTLECFYDFDCLQYLISVYHKNITISPLDITLPSRFTSRTKISQLFTDLFIEYIAMTINHTRYYDECDPISCTFTYSYRFSFIYVITTLVALLGGLTVVLRLVCPYMIDTIFFIMGRLSMRTEDQEEQDEPMPLRDRIKNLILKISSLIIQLNVFDDPAYDQSDIRMARVFTRLYLTIVCSSVIIIALYIFVSKETVTKTIVLPSLSQYEKLEETYGDSLSCPCNTISMSYRNIIEIKPVYHQLCQSDFVQAEWFTKLQEDSDNFELGDFRSLYSPYFYSLAGICDTFQETLSNAIQIFSITVYTNTHVIPRDLFDSQITSTISDFQISTKAQFSYSFSTINSTLNAELYTSSSMLTVAFLTFNTLIGGSNVPNPIRVITIAGSDTSDTAVICTCVRNVSCTWNWNTTGLWNVNGIVVHCNVIETVLRSTLVCLFNTSCVNELKANLNFRNVTFVTNARPLNSLLQSRFSPDTTIKTMFDEMMVESWNINTSYETFYELCRPSYCTFTYEQQFSILYAIMTLAGLIGGLNLVLRWICFFLMKFVSLIISVAETRNRSSSHDTEEVAQNPSVLVTHSSPWMVLKNKLLSLNLFRDESDEINDITHQHYSTRLYLLMLIMCLSIIIIYTAGSQESVIRIVTSPSEQEYQNLLKLQNARLSCPCSKISFSYSTVININAKFHQVCTSDFVDDPWIDFLFGYGAWGLENRSDIRGRGAACFSLLSVLCSQVQDSINRATKEFLEQTRIYAQPMAPSDFQVQTDAAIHSFLTSTNDNIIRILQMIQSYLYSNAFISAYFLNWNMWIKDIRGQYPPILASPNQLNNKTCSCATRSDCREPAGIYGIYDTAPRWIVPGFYIACSVYDSLMQSTLECFYVQQCISMLETYATSTQIAVPPPPNNVTFKPLDSTRPSRFPVKSSIHDLVNELFVEEWITNASYSAFYQQCSPLYCSYIMQYPSSIVYIASRILGLYGGLTLALRLIIPKVVRIYLLTWKRCIRNEASVGQQADR